MASQRMLVLVAISVGCTKLLVAAGGEPTPANVGIRAEPAGWVGSVPVSETQFDSRDMEARQCPPEDRLHNINDFIFPCGVLVHVDQGRRQYVGLATKPFVDVPENSPRFGRCERPIDATFRNLVALAKPTDWCAFQESGGGWTIAGVDGQYYRLNADLGRADPMSLVARVWSKFNVMPWAIVLAFALITGGIWFAFRRHGDPWQGTLGVFFAVASVFALAPVWASFSYP